MPKQMLAIKYILEECTCISIFIKGVAFNLIITLSITSSPSHVHCIPSLCNIPRRFCCCYSILLLYYTILVLRVIHWGAPQTQLLGCTFTNSYKQTFHTLDVVFSFRFLDWAFHIFILNSSTRTAGSGDTSPMTNPIDDKSNYAFSSYLFCLIDFYVGFHITKAGVKPPSQRLPWIFVSVPTSLESGDYQVYVVILTKPMAALMPGKIFY